MELDRTELQVLMMGSPYKGALHNKPIHCVLLSGAPRESKPYSRR